MNKKGKKIRHIMAGILISAIFAGVFAGYGIPHLYASPKEKTVKTMKQSADTLKEVLGGFVDKVVQLDPMGNHTYTGNITVSEFTYDGADYRPDTTNNSHKYSVVTDNNNITFSMPQVEDGTLVVDKNDILPYGLAKIDSGKTEAMLRAVLSHIMNGYEVAVKDNFDNFNNIGNDNKSDKNDGSMTAIGTISDERCTITISDKSLIAGFNIFVEEMYKDSAILPYISLLNVHGITIDKIKSKFNMYAEGVYTTITMDMDDDGRLTGAEFAFKSDSDTRLANISVRFTGEKNLYDSIYMTVSTSVINNNYINASIQLDMQDMDNIKHDVETDVKYHRHNMRLKAAGDIKAE